MNFCFSKAAKEDSADPETYIINPGKYSREIQLTRQIELDNEIMTERWHIPASDRSAWLCLTTNATPSSTSSPTTLLADSAVVADSLTNSYNNFMKNQNRIEDRTSEIKKPPAFIPQAKRKLF
jgi:hypothetical protein